MLGFSSLAAYALGDDGNVSVAVTPVQESVSGWGGGFFGEFGWGGFDPALPSVVSSVGDVLVITDQAVSVTGVETAGAVGGVEVIIDQAVSVTGVETAGAVGIVAQKTSQKFLVTGVAGTTAVGSVTTICDANVFVTGVQAGIPASRVLVWGREIPDPGTIWTEIAA